VSGSGYSGTDISWTTELGDTMPREETREAKLNGLLDTIRHDLVQVDRAWENFCAECGEPEVIYGALTERLKQAQVVRNALNKIRRALEQWEVRTVPVDKYAGIDVRTEVLSGDDPGGRHLPV